MNFLRGLEVGILILAKMFINVAVWFAIMIGFFVGLIALNKEYYQPNDTPNPKFQIAVVTVDNRTKPIHWQDLNNQTIATKPDESCAKHCLLQKNDNLIYHSEGAMWTSASEYRIVNQTIQPVSYSFYSLNEGLQAFFLSFIGYALVKYGFLRI